MILEFFPEAFIALNQELPHHPELLKLLQNHPQGETEIILAEIAAYCEVGLDAAYTKEDLIKLCEILRARLVKKRQGVLVLTSNTIGLIH